MYCLQNFEITRKSLKDIICCLTARSLSFYLGPHLCAVRGIWKKGWIDGVHYKAVAGI